MLVLLRSRLGAVPRSWLLCSCVVRNGKQVGIPSFFVHGSCQPTAHGRNCVHTTVHDVRCNALQRAGSSMPSVGTQTYTSLVAGGAYDGSPRCPAPASQHWFLGQKPSWHKETRRAGVRQRPRCPDQRVLRHKGINTHGGHMAAVVWDWITEPQSLDQTQAETCGGARSQS